ncbi:hypothetical protein [Prescottella agglutinans]|uniref:Transcriptional regulator with XRE-family HTH domain n=1 Tax=Prescottella agglutinans TaxID=1644129 RepID=A0ABT6M6F5_9NOCA|nr:hypothetical protein [Prescottella agglutinans]MDH6279500.1 transcriptional regulator with XRE-family HTH domain [Prescottella agglutinans]
MSTTAEGTWPEDLGRREKALEAMRLRKDLGLTWEEIAEEAGYSSRQAAQRAVSRVLARVESETVEDYRQLMSARYDDLYRRTIAALDTADQEGQLMGKSQLLAAGRGIVDSIVKLHGLAAPQKADVTVHTKADVDDEVQALIDKLAERENTPEG